MSSLGDRPAGFVVRRTRCASCIYRKDSPLDLERLEAEVRDPYGGFWNHRTCHHTRAACCRGFWNRHKDGFQAGQVAQRFGLVIETDEDLYPTLEKNP